MKKSDLISGKHVVEMRNGKRRLLLGETFMDKSNWATLGSYHDSLKNCHMDEWDIVKVFEITNFKSGFKELLEHRDLKLIWERKAELSNIEKSILENLDYEYKYITRDKDGELKIFKDSVWRMRDFWDSKLRGDCFPFRNLFQMIKWQDEEPTLIAGLLEGSKQR